MRRRSLLAALGGATALGSAGLLARATDGRTLSVSSAPIPEAALSLDRHVDPDNVARPLDSVDPPRRGALDRALEGGYETDRRRTDLADFLDRHRYVSDGESVYRLSDTFPALVVSAAPVEHGAVEGPVADYAGLEEALGPIDAARRFLRRARTDGFVDRLPGDDVVEFFERHAGLRVDGTVYALSVRRRDATAPYALTAERVDAVRSGVPADLVDSLTALPEQLRGRMRSTVESRSDTVALDDPTDDLLDRLRATRLLAIDGELYGVDVRRLAHLGLSLSVEVVEAGMGFKNPARVAITVRNSGDRPLTFSSRPLFSPNPVSVAPEGDDGEEYHLYPADGGDSIFFARSGSVDYVSASTLDPGGAARREYAFGGDAVGVSRGTYVLSETAWVRGGLEGATHGGRRIPVPIRAEFVVE